MRTARKISLLLILMLLLSLACAALAEPSITQQPEGATVCEEDIFTVSVKASGSQLSYRWEYALPGSTTGRPCSELASHFAGSSTGTLMGKLPAGYNGMKLVCLITDAAGKTVISDFVTIAVKEHAQITRQTYLPDTLYDNQMGRVMVQAQGYNLSYCWQYSTNGTTWQDCSVNVAFDATDTTSLKATLNHVFDGNMHLRCKVTDGMGHAVYSDPLTVDLYKRLEILDQPDAGEFPVEKGQTASIELDVKGEGLTYEWYYRNAGASTFSKTSSFTGNTYSVKMDASRSGRQVYCVIKDQEGYSVRSNTVTLVLDSVALITRQPKSVSVPAGEKATVSLEAAGDGLTYTWYFKNAGAAKFSKTTSFNGNTYSVTMDATRSGRQVYCIVTDKSGNSVRSDTVSLTIAQPVKITVQPKSVAVQNGETAKVSFTATGDGLAYTWYYRNKTASSFSKTTTFTGNSYTVKMDADRDGRQVYCIVRDRYGNAVRTNTVTLTMGTPLKITAQPKSASAANGEKATVSLKATGDGLTYTWYFKNAGAAKFSKTTSFTGNTYTVKMDDTRDGRQVYCVVKDKYGNSVKSETATLTMGTPLKITVQPQSDAAPSGQKVNVSFTAVGDGLTYTWYFRDADVEGDFSKTSTFKSNTYSVIMDESRNGRELYCVVRDQHGNSVTTNTVTIRMASKLAITSQPADVYGECDWKVEVWLTAVGDGLTYEWYYKNAGASSFTRTDTFKSNTYTVTMDYDRDGRQVYCIVRDKYGNSVKSDIATLYIVDSWD